MLLVQDVTSEPGKYSLSCLNKFNIKLTHTVPETILNESR